MALQECAHTLVGMKRARPWEEGGALCDAPAACSSGSVNPPAGAHLPSPAGSPCASDARTTAFGLRQGRLRCHKRSLGFTHLVISCAGPCRHAQYAGLGILLCPHCLAYLHDEDQMGM